MNDVLNYGSNFQEVIKLAFEFIKACSSIELFGYLHSRTNDWNDGLFSSIFRDMNISPIEQEVRRHTLIDMRLLRSEDNYLQH